MPNDSETLDKTPTTVTAWVEKFNKAKGWKPLKTPSAGQRVKRSPKHQFELAKAEAFQEKEAAKLAKQQAKIKMDALEKEATSQEDPEKKQRAEAVFEEAQDAYSEAVAALNTTRIILRRQSKKLKTLTKVEEDLEGDLDTVATRVLELQDALFGQINAPFAASSKSTDEGQLSVVQDMRNLVARNIEKTRGEVFKLIRVVDGEETERSYAVICSAEYKILHAMLDEAMLIYLTGDAEKAKDAINKTTQQLNEYRNARTGATIIKQQETAFDGRLSGPLGEIDWRISWLHTNGFVPCAEALETQADDLRSLIQETSPETAFDRHNDAVETLKNTVTTEVRYAEACIQTTLNIHKNIATLRAMDASDTADFFTSELDRDENLDSVLSERLKALMDVEQESNTIIETIKNLQTGSNKINVEKMNEQLKGLQEKYEDFFKKDKKGEIKTIKDSQTQQPKGDKKDSKIPREALNELEMKLLAAQQLLESDSIDALKLAEEYLDEVERFETSVGDNSQSYKDIIIGLGLTHEKLNRLKTKYVAYEASRTIDLAARVEKFEGSYKSIDPKKAYIELAALYRESSRIKENAQARRAEYKMCEELSQKIKSKIKSLSKAMVKYKDNIVELTGYYGKFVDELAAAQRLADARDENSLREAIGKMITLDDQVASRLDLVKKSFSKKSKGVLKGSDLTDWDALVADAVQGQKKENARAENKEKFDAEHDALKTKFTKLIDLFKKLNLESSELDVTLKEIDSLKTRAEASGDYEDGLKRLKELNADANRHTKTGSEMARFTKIDIEAATKDCADKMRAFKTAVLDFEDVITSIGDLSQLKEPDSGDVITPNDVESFLDTVAGLVRPDDIKKLEANGKALKKALTTPGGDPRPPREAALSAVRTMTGALQTNGPLAHFRKQPFTSGTPELDIAANALSRLELKLLTAIPK